MDDKWKGRGGRWGSSKVVAVLAVAFGVILAACGSSSSPVKSSAGTKLTPLSFAVFPASMPSLPVFAAAGLGYFKTNGVAATMVDTSSGSAAAAALAAGGAQFGIVTVPELVNLRPKGVDLRIVAPAYSDFPQDLWCTNNVSVADPGKYPNVIQELKGKSVGITSQGSLTADMVNYSQIAAGLPINYMKVISVGSGPSAIAALKSGAVDCIVAYEPMEYQLTQQNLGRSVLSWEHNQGPTAFDNYAYTQVGAEQSYLQANPKVGNAVKAAIAQANTFISNPSNAPKVAKAVAAYFPGLDITALTSIIHDHISHDLARTITPAQVSNAQMVGNAVHEQTTTLPFNQLVFGG